MWNGSSSPSVKITEAQTISHEWFTERLSSEKVFLFAAVIKDAGLQDFVRIGRTLGATLQNTIRLFIAHLHTTCGLGSPTRQCLRENEQHEKGSSYPALLWKVRSDFVKRKPMLSGT